MRYRMAELRKKEVINLSDGQKLGYAGDLELDAAAGQVLSLIVPGPYRFFGLFGRGEDLIIPWDCIVRMSPDVILIDSHGELRRERAGRRKSGFWENFFEKSEEEA